MRVTVLIFVLGVLLAALALIASIALHEVGHLLPAKLFRVRVMQYMVGFGPTLFSRVRGETEYGIKAVPLGGYVAMVGMYPPVAGHRAGVDSTGVMQQMTSQTRSVAAAQLLPGDEDRAFYRLPVWKRIVIMLGGPIMNLLIAIVCITVLVTGFGSQQPTTTLATVSRCVQAVDPAAASQSAPASEGECAQDDPAAPAHAAGLRPGDVVVSLGGSRVESWDELTEIVREGAGQPIEVAYDRDGERASTTITPVETSRPAVDSTGAPIVEDGRYVMQDVGFIGASSLTELTPQPISAVPGEVLNGLERVAGGLIRLPVNVWNVAVSTFTDAPRDPEGPMSVVGVGRISGEVASTDQLELREKTATLVGLVGSVNLALFAFNLIPLLPLDGGHIAGALWERIRRTAARVLGRRDPGPFDPLRLLPMTYAVSLTMLAMTAVLVLADLMEPVQLL
ncbi:M50 family metallopeptidase [Kocuria palustris]|uniref:M50 family metallopeptidase n=1 Tax=Kocuria palustris TaxID=71999 RepID=UPI003665DA17